MRKELRVYVNNCNTTDRSCVRNYINVVDLAKAHAVAVERMLNSRSNEKIEIFNLGTGKGSSVLELINFFEKATGVKVPYRIVDRREGDIEQVWANTDYANNVLDWKASKTHLNPLGIGN